jgi:hypothetical protein
METDFEFFGMLPPAVGRSQERDGAICGHQVAGAGAGTAGPSRSRNDGRVPKSSGPGQGDHHAPLMMRVRLPSSSVNQSPTIVRVAGIGAS